MDDLRRQEQKLLAILAQGTPYKLVPKARPRKLKLKKRKAPAVKAYLRSMADSKGVIDRKAVADAAEDSGLNKRTVQSMFSQYINKGNLVPAQGPNQFKWVDTPKP